jgi:hypothetical protein
MSTSEYAVLQTMEVSWQLYAFLIIVLAYSMVVCAVLGISDWVKRLIATKYFTPEQLINWWPWDAVIAIVIATTVVTQAIQLVHLGS